MRRIHPRHTVDVLQVRPLQRDPITWDSELGEPQSVRAQVEHKSEVLSDDEGNRVVTSLVARIPPRQYGTGPTAADFPPRSQVLFAGEVLSVISLQPKIRHGRVVYLELVAGEQPEPPMVRVAIVDPSRSTPGVIDPDEGVYGPNEPFFVAGGPQDERPQWRSGVPAYVEPFGMATEAVQIGQQVATRRYLVRLPVALPAVQSGHQVRVLSALLDPQMVNVSLTVVDVRYTSAHGERVIVCEHNQQRSISHQED